VLIGTPIAATNNFRGKIRETYLIHTEADYTEHRWNTDASDNEGIELKIVDVDLT
jgi:hypothetical protein